MDGVQFGSIYRAVQLTMPQHQLRAIPAAVCPIGKIGLDNAVALGGITIEWIGMGIAEN